MVRPMKTTMTVNARSTLTGDMLARDIEVTLVENAAGRVYLKGCDPRVEVTDLCGAEGKIKETVLVLQANATRPVLYGTVTPVGKSKSVPLELATENRPLHRELYDAALAIMIAANATRNAIWAEEKAVKEAAATADFPAGSVRLRFVGSEADGWVELWADDAGRTLRSPELGGRNGTWGWMTVEDHAAATAVKVEPVATEVAVDLLAAEVPPAAVAAYARYEGDADAAWEDEDEEACMLIREFGPAIEAQGLGQPRVAMAKSDELSTHEG